MVYVTANNDIAAPFGHGVEHFPRYATMAPKLPATIVEVARTAGVSTATVSRTINKVGPVSAAAERRVRAAIEALNYTRRRRRSGGPGPAATATASSSRRPFAFLRLGAFPSHLHHSMTDAVMEGLGRASRELGRSLSVGHVPDLEQVKVRQVVGDAEGVVIRTSNQREMIEQAIEWLDGIPAVLVLGENRSGRTLVDHVTPDNAEVGALAAEYLAEEGCRRLVFATTDAGSSVTMERCISFVRAARRSGLPVDAVIRGENGGAERLAEELSALEVDCKVADNRLELARTVATIEAGAFGLFMPRDLELAMVMPQLQVLGVDFGSSAVAIGCDHEQRCLMELEPTPASIDLHIEDVARRAIRRLAYRIEHPAEPRVRITVAPDIVPSRQSGRVTPNRMASGEADDAPSGTRPRQPLVQEFATPTQPE